MDTQDWTTEFRGSIMVCDLSGRIIHMNMKAAENYRESGGIELIGRNILECHPEPARSKLAHLLKTGECNSYTIEKRGTKKFIHQAPWYQDGRMMGLIEFAIEIPFDLPHFIRK